MIAAALAGLPRALWPDGDKAPGPRKARRRPVDVEVLVDDQADYVERPRWSDNRYGEVGT